QKSHVDHSDNPQLVQAGERLHMGQVSVTILAVAGSGLSDNQQIKPHAERDMAKPRLAASFQDSST
ncbi:hypothetical protein, partial [Sediminimonas qiaohouensis]|uniref:hypothetical protein n=1 Tax=Sediminimonas qiaohouensis TaxID=552061 RepID=UPI002356E1B4